MPRPNVLRRCAICKKYGAPFLVATPAGTTYYCYECWKKAVTHPPAEPSPNEKAQAEQPPARQRRDE